jgi:hypothetical protein
MYCAATAADCPFVATSHKLMKMAIKRLGNYTCGPDELTCPDGCCPEPTWCCVPESIYCAPECWPFAASNKLMKMATKKQCGAGETACPAGCCPEANWFCCPDNMYCAATAADCPFVAASNKLIKMTIKEQCGAEEIMCPSGYCCPEVAWFCCHDSMYCAATAEDCWPFDPVQKQLRKMFSGLE